MKKKGEIMSIQKFIFYYREMSGMKEKHKHIIQIKIIKAMILITLQNKKKKQKMYYRTQIKF